MIDTSTGRRNLLGSNKKGWLQENIHMQYLSKRVFSKPYHLGLTVTPRTYRREPKLVLTQMRQSTVSIDTVIYIVPT